jgi:DNA-binding Xre family transcriptional regulator
VVAFARKWGIDGRLARRAASGQDVNSSAHLKLCAAIGIDPVDGSKRDPRFASDIDWNRVGIKVLLALIHSSSEPGKKTAMREAAQRWKLPLVTLARMKAGQPVNIANLLNLCAALGCHPHEFLRLVPVDVSQKQQPERTEAKEEIN